MSRIILALLILFISSFQLLYAQTREQTGWIASFNSLRFSEKWGMHFDLQVRSADDLDYVRNLLVRPGLTYFLTDKQNITAGYALIGTFARPGDNTTRNLTEHRIWEQYILNHKIRNIAITHRLRLEQRFIERAAEDVFSQRLRYFVRGVIPLKPVSGTFTNGLFTAVQNELFFNLQNKDKVNNAFFDQNRAYLALGYRLNKKFDLEAGYLNQYTNGLSRNIMNHIVQVAAYTRF